MGEDDELVELGELLAACVAACSLGCREVQQWEVERRTRSETQAELKDPTDIRSYVTQADLASQAVIVSALQAEWPGLRIVGEEDGAVPVAVTPPGTAAAVRVERARLAGLETDTMLAPLSELAVLVDPVDGTRELVEGRLAAVQTLVGVAWRGRAVAGAVGLPFPDGELTATPVVAYGLVGSGYGRACTRDKLEVEVGTAIPSATAEQDTSLLYASGDSSSPVLAAAKAVLVAASARAREGAEWRLLGGAGNKLLAAAEGRVAAVLMHCGTSLWDTCAPEAVLRAMGGNITDLFGAPIKYYLDRPGGLINQFGVVGVGPGFEAGWGCSLATVCAGMRSCPALLRLLEPHSGPGAGQGGAQAGDVARCLQGSPLSTTWLQDKLLPSLPQAARAARLLSYRAPEAGASRDLMSDVCRLQLEWNTTHPALPPSVFYKRIVIGDLAHARMKAKTAPQKLARDVKSYTIEAEFLGSAACEQLVTAGIPVARAFSVQREICKMDPIDSRFSLLLEDFAPSSGWRQHRLLGPAAARATLAAFARLHAFFWEGSAFWRAGGPAAAELEGAVWGSGSYWQPAMQPAEQLEGVAAGWERHREAFQQEFTQTEELQGVDLATLGERLQAVVHRVGQRAHPFSEAGAGLQGFRTLIHGDAKAANIFLRETEDQQYQVGLIDFQWCGFGLAATEIAHHIFVALDMSVLSYDGSAEAALLDCYYAHLLAALVEFAVASDLETAARLLPRTTLQDQYETAVLDMCRTVFGYHWVRIQASPAVLENNKDSLGRNSYNKSLPHAKWVVAACNRALHHNDVVCKQVR